MSEIIIIIFFFLGNASAETGTRDPQRKSYNNLISVGTSPNRLRNSFGHFSISSPFCDVKVASRRDLSL